MYKINLKPFRDFLHSKQIGGVILLGCVCISLVIANSSLGIDLENLLSYEI